MRPHYRRLRTHTGRLVSICTTCGENCTEWTENIIQRWQRAHRCATRQESRGPLRISGQLSMRDGRAYIEGIAEAP